LQWLLATRNRDKVKELQELLSEYPLRLLSLHDFPDLPPTEETGNTLEENAILKARLSHEATGLPVIADDTGLFVEALNGEPGVKSARYAGEQATYADNRNLLLRKMESAPPGQRGATFKTVVVFYTGQDEIIATGATIGEITHRPMGSNGFGYDPIFYVTEAAKTYAEMSLAEKNAVSHRGRALRALLQQLKPYLEKLTTESPIG